MPRVTLCQGENGKDKEKNKKDFKKDKKDKKDKKEKEKAKDKEKKQKKEKSKHFEPGTDKKRRKRSAQAQRFHTSKRRPSNERPCYKQAVPCSTVLCRTPKDDKDDEVDKLLSFDFLNEAWPCPQKLCQSKTSFLPLPTRTVQRAQRVKNNNFADTNMQKRGHELSIRSDSTNVCGFTILRPLT